MVSFSLLPLKDSWICTHPAAAPGACRGLAGGEQGDVTPGRGDTSGAAGCLSPGRGRQQHAESQARSLQLLCALSAFI